MVAISCGLLQWECQHSRRADRAPGRAGPVRRLLGGEDSPADLFLDYSHRWTQIIADAKTPDALRVPLREYVATRFSPFVSFVGFYRSCCKRAWASRNR